MDHPDAPHLLPDRYERVSETQHRVHRNRRSDDVAQVRPNTQRLDPAVGEDIARHCPSFDEQAAAGGSDAATLTAGEDHEHAVAADGDLAPICDAKGVR